MSQIECVCINDANKPKEIPANKWVKKGDKYHIIHIFSQINQGGVKGVVLQELDVSMHKPYNCFILSRFAFKPEYLLELFKLMKECGEFNELSDLDIQKLVDDIPIKEKELVENRINKSKNHNHFWVKDGVLYESYNTLRGMRYREICNCVLPDLRKVKDELIEHLNAVLKWSEPE